MRLQVESWRYSPRYMYPMTKMEISEVREVEGDIREVHEVIGLDDRRFLILADNRLLVMRYEEVRAEKVHETKLVAEDAQIREAKMLVTGRDGEKTIIVILLIKEYEVFYFDLQGLITGVNKIPLQVTYSYQTYEFDYMISLKGMDHRFFMVQQSNYLSFFESNFIFKRQTESEIYPQVPVMSVPYSNLPTLAYITAVELNQPCPEMSKGTYTTLAISEYRSNKIQILKIFDNTEDPEKKLRHEWCKTIHLTFQINYNIQEVPGFPNMLIAIGDAAVEDS